jgi:hypothetical protein
MPHLPVPVHATLPIDAGKRPGTEHPACGGDALADGIGALFLRKPTRSEPGFVPAATDLPVRHGAVPPASAKDPRPGASPAKDARSIESWLSRQVTAREHFGGGIDHLADILSSRNALFAACTLTRGAVEAAALGCYLTDQDIDGRERPKATTLISLAVD